MRAEVTETRIARKRMKMGFKKLKIILAASVFCTSFVFAEDESRAPDFGVSPFVVYGDHLALGVEFNRWYMGVDPGWSEENSGNTPISRTFYLGYGARLYYDYDEDHGAYASPMVSVSYVGLGLSASPDVGLNAGHLDYGYSIRAWFLLFGAELSWTKDKDQRFGFYFYYPISCPMCYYY